MPCTLKSRRNTIGWCFLFFVADQRTYRGMTWFQLRELAATLNAFVELFITRPTPVLGGKLPIVL